MFLNPERVVDDSDSDMEDLEHIMSESTKQLDVTHGTLNKLKRDISVEAKKYTQLMAICQTNIKCLGVVRSHIESAIEHRKTTISTEDLFAVEDILEEWEILRAITADKQHRCSQMDKESKLEAKFVPGGGGGASTPNAPEDNYVGGIPAAGDISVVGKCRSSTRDNHLHHSRQCQQQQQQQQHHQLQHLPSRATSHLPSISSSSPSFQAVMDSAYPTSASSASLNRPSLSPKPTTTTGRDNIGGINGGLNQTGSGSSGGGGSGGGGSNLNNRIPDALTEEKEEEEVEEMSSSMVTTSTPLPDVRHPDGGRRRRRPPPVGRPEGISTLTESLDSSLEDVIKLRLRMQETTVDDDDADVGGAGTAATATYGVGRCLADEFVVNIGRDDDDKEDEGNEDSMTKSRKPRSRPLSPTTSMFANSISDTPSSFGVCRAFSRVTRAALPVSLLLLVSALGFAFFHDGAGCCSDANALKWSLQPQLRYFDGPPPL